MNLFFFRCKPRNGCWVSTPGTQPGHVPRYTVTRGLCISTLLLFNLHRLTIGFPFDLSLSLSDTPQLCHLCSPGQHGMEIWPVNIWATQTLLYHEARTRVSGFGPLRLCSVQREYRGEEGGGVCVLITELEWLTPETECMPT